jgi:hypothetical protein
MAGASAFTLLGEIANAVEASAAEARMRVIFFILK